MTFRAIGSRRTTASVISTAEVRCFAQARTEQLAATQTCCRPHFSVRPASSCSLATVRRSKYIQARPLSLQRRYVGSASSVDLDASSEETAHRVKAARKAQWKRSNSSTSFVDSLNVNVAAGAGGDGCVSFSRAKYVPYGPPSGGGGGRGGDIYIRAVSDMRSLARVPSRAEGGMGGHGKGEWNVGNKGKDVLLKVPVGTVVTVEKVHNDEEEYADAQRILRAEYEEELMARFGKKLRRGRARSPRLRPDPPAPRAAVEAEDAEEGDEFEEHPRWDQEAEDALALEATQQRARRDAMWRHYPGTSAGVGGGGAPATVQGVIEESDADIAASRKEFTAAEERLAMAIYRERDADEERARAIERARVPVEDSDDAHEDLDTWSIDLDTPTPADSPGVLLARGGSGGFGNPFFLSTGSISRSPKLATRGAFGERVRVRLELKSPADVGLVGFPNAGKSTLLQALTSAGRAGGAAAKVGGYEFTTLSPNVGVMRLGEQGALLGIGKGLILETAPNALVGSGAKEAEAVDVASSSAAKEREASRLTLADLPGLIRGASDNRGLGHLFLRHAERCRALFYVVDVSESKPAPWDEVKILRNELEAYRPGLSERCVAIVANKCDALGPQAPAVFAAGQTLVRSTADDARAKLQKLSQEAAKAHDGRVLPVLPVSAMHRLGVEAVGAQMNAAVEKSKANEAAKDGSAWKWDASAPTPSS